MNLGLESKSVVVTGGSRGIGRAIAHQFAAEGANVAFCARGTEAMLRTRDELSAAGVEVFAACCDVADSAALRRFLNEARARLGAVDVLVNNASALVESDDETGWAQSVDVDLMASIRATRWVTPWMEAGEGGAIVHVSSISGLEAGSPPAYAAMKAALINHAKTMAELLAPKNIRINCVAPGSILFDGGLWEEVRRTRPSFYEEVLGEIPFGRMGTPEEVADAVVFLASPRASWISGTTLVVDGVQHKGV